MSGRAQNSLVPFFLQSRRCNLLCSRLLPELSHEGVCRAMHMAMQGLKSSGMMSTRHFQGSDEEM